MAEPSRPSGKKWLYYLFFRPRRFFTHFVLEPVPMLTGLACYVFGVANVIDNIETRMMRAELSGRSSLAEAARSWPVYWTICLLVGVVSAAMIYWIGGWWYHRRLLMCGAQEPERALTQRVYVFASLVWAFPVVMYTLWETGTYASPRAAMSGDDVGGLAILGFLFWSLATSYFGVVTAFTVRRGLALLWFVALPAVVYVMIFSAVIAAMFMVSESGVQPNVRSPQTHSRAGFQFRYPGNWSMNKDAATYDPDSDMLITPPYADCAVSLRILEAQDEAAALADYREHHEREFSVRTWRKLAKWGRLAGIGAMGTGRSEGQDYRIQLFVGKHDDRLLIVQELCHAPASKRMQPGLQLIRRTFRWH